MADNNMANIAVPDMKLELVPVPVSDVDRAKAFYEKAGFKLNVDTQPTDTMRVVQFTPPGSACSIVMGTGMPGISDMQPGSVKGLHLVVADIDKAREALVKRELEVSEITDFSGVKYADFSEPTVYVGSSTKNAAKKRYSYYQCHGRLRAYQDKRKAGPGCPAVQARWLEELVWADVRRFLHDPGEVLERLREQQDQDRQSDDLEAHRNSLAKRLASKQAEKDRYVRLYARGQILDEKELETYLADVVNQVENLKLLISSVEADLARAEEDRKVAASTEAWLMTLRENLQEVEADTQEAFDKRRDLVRLLVERIDVSRTEDGRPKLDITYRFGSPTTESAEECADGVRNSGRLTGEMYFGA